MTSDSALDRRRNRPRRRPVRRFEPDTTVPSPCIAVCQLDPKTGYCLGCFRNPNEIREWPIMSADDKRQVLKNIADRKDDN
ncbi:MAG: DUF1289 domain-containing protein [Pseudomonadota bacterium]